MNGTVKISPLSIVLFLVVFLSGCSGLSGVQDVPMSFSHLEQLTSKKRPQAVQQLIRDGRESWTLGNMEKGLVTLNRALRISPDDALIYYYLASIRKQQGKLGMSVNLARRGLSLAYHPVLRNQLNGLLISLSAES